MRPDFFDPLTSAAASARRFRLVLDAPCPHHAARPGRPCWRIPAASPTAATPWHQAVCDKRVQAARLTMPSAAVRETADRLRVTATASALRHGNRRHA